MQKNVASQKVGAQMVTAADGSAFTGSVTVSVTGDAGTQATGSVGSGACTHEGNGYHTYAPAQAETNYDLIAFTFTGTGAIPVTVQVYTRHDANVTHNAGTAITSSGGRQEVNVARVDGAALASHLSGYFPSEVLAWVSSTIQPGVFTTQINTLYNDWVNGGRLDLLLDATLADTNAILVDTGTTLDGKIDAIKTKTDFLPSATAGSAGGVFIAGTNAATTVTTSFTTTFTGNLTGSVGSVSGAVGSVTGNVGGNVTGSVGSVVGAVGSVTGNVGGNVTGSVGSVVGAVGSVTAGVTVTTNNDKTGYSLSQAFPSNFSSLAITVGGAVTAGTVSDKTGYSVVSTGLDLVLVDGVALPKALQRIGAVTAGKLPSGAGTSTEAFQGLDGATTRVTFTVDASGNRTAVTYNDT